MENEFYKYYKERVMPALQQQHGYKNIHQVPKVDKVVINTSVGSQADVKQALDDARWNWRSSPVSTRPRPGRRRAFRISSCARTRRLAPRSHCAANGCMNF